MYPVANWMGGGGTTNFYASAVPTGAANAAAHRYECALKGANKSTIVAHKIATHIRNPKGMKKPDLIRALVRNMGQSLSDVHDFLRQEEVVPMDTSE